MLNNRYRILCTLGNGGFGETSLAEDTQMPSQRRCVIKQLKPIHDNPQIYQLVQERFQREAAILEELGGSSNQIPNLYAYFQLDDRFYLVQEYIEGDTLTAKLRQYGVLSESTVTDLLISLLPVLEYIHSKHIIHRDIKPDNIILRYRDGKPVLIDFGAVREIMGTALNSQGSPTSSIIIGTPGYMPSEQAMGRPIYASDLYSLGLTAIYLLTGKLPQELQTHPNTGEIIWHPHSINVSTTMAAILNRAIAYHPRERFFSAREMLEALLSSRLVIPSTAPVTQPPSFSPTLSTESPETLLFQSEASSRESVTQNHGQRGILALSIIVASGLIGASIFLGFILTRTPQSIEQPTSSLNKPSQASPNVSFSPKSQVTEHSNSSSPNKTNPSSQNPSIPRQQNVNQANFPNAFYFLADSAYPSSQTALMQVKALQAVGYSKAGMFRIPEYPNLSGKELFSVYVERFSDRNKCIDLLKTYGQINSDAYCAFASKDPNTPPERIFFKEISTSSGTRRGANAPTDNYSWLSQREVTDADLDGKDGFELDIMRNTIFARHGRRFKIIELQKYFEEQLWYRPKYSPETFPNELLSDLERWNVEYINKYQDRYNRRYFR